MTRNFLKHYEQPTFTVSDEHHISCALWRTSGEKKQSQLPNIRLNTSCPKTKSCPQHGNKRWAQIGRTFISGTSTLSGISH